MTIGIYCISHRATGRCYIGKSRNIEQRRWQHKYQLTKPDLDKKHANRYLYSAVQKYGWDAFDFAIMESHAEISSADLSARELFWMDAMFSCTNGFNLRRDSSSGMEVALETRMMLSIMNSGEGNGNYGNNWTDAQKSAMSAIATGRHASGKFYGDEWRAKMVVTSTATWSDLQKRAEMGKKVAKAKKKYHFMQLSRAGDFIRAWPDIDSILAENPGWKWQNIYSVCNGYKPTYMGFKWMKVLWKKQ